MNVANHDRIVLLGFLSHFPVAGVAWQTIHYLVGFQRLGFEVYYVEAHGCTPSKLMQTATDDGAILAAAYIDGIMRRFGLEHRWAYHSLHDGRCFGLSQSQLNALYESAALLINLHGSHLPRPELAGTGRLVYLETDPVDVQIDLFNRKTETLEYLAPHCAFFTYGENLGNPDCLVPVPQGFKFLPTRQPVVLDFWDKSDGDDAKRFTTIGNWRQPWREVMFRGELYRWSKHFEFLKFLDLPSRTPQAFELALSSYDEQDRQLLDAHGWQVRPALEVSTDLDVYRHYITESRAEFTVAKDQNVRLRSGWFSDRAATYLAAGRPVITQETGFSRILPSGEGLFGFSTMDEILAAVEAINANYRRNRERARIIARECFSHDIVLKRLLDGVGTPWRELRHSDCTVLPQDLCIVPASRWPTRLPEETLRVASGLPVPVVRPCHTAADRRASIVIVVHNGLAYTRMCLTALLGEPWGRGDEVIVVDNASSDGTPEFLRDLAGRNPCVKVLRNDVNRGFAAGNNQGVGNATADTLILLNNDTLVLPGWRTTLLRWLEDESVGMVGPVTNRTCNEAQIDAPYRTYGELERFASEYSRAHSAQASKLSMLAMFCVALRRDVFERVGPLDERFEIGMFEDDDYSKRVRQAGYQLLCAEDVFVHHFGQASLGELCTTKEYDGLLARNRRRYEEKWGATWHPHSRRLTPEYVRLRERVQAATSAYLPSGSTIAVISKGDEELLKLNGHRAWHFPQAPDGSYANLYPAHSEDALAQLDALRTKGARFLLIPKPAFWWLEHYAGLRTHLETRCRLAVRDEESCLIFELGDHHD